VLKIKTRKTHSGPMVTVGMPVYNAEKYLAESVESILAQDYEDFEFIISDNGSDDGTHDICRHYEEKDSRIKYYRYPKNLGSQKNYRHVLEAASGKYFMWNASDDLREPTMLTECLPVLENDPSIVVCYPRTKSINENGEFLNIAKDYVKADQETPKERFASILWNLALCNALYGLMRTDALHEVRWPATSSHGSDHIVLGELALLGKLVQIPKPLFLRRFYTDTPRFSTIEENNSYCMRIFDTKSDREGISLPFCEFAFETMNAVRLSTLDEDDKADLIVETLKCFRTRWKRQVFYEVRRAIDLIRKREFRMAWGQSSSVKGHRITDQLYVSTILARLETAFFLLPGLPGLQEAHDICLGELGRLDGDSHAAAPVKSGRKPEDAGVRKATRAYIEISGVCNGKCPYCTQRRLRQAGHSGSVMSPVLFGQVLDRLLELDVIDRAKTPDISLYNWGEPSLNPKINEILHTLKERGLRARISSNFIKKPDIDKEYIPVISSLALSLSGFSQDSYGRIHGASLEETLNNFDNLYSEICRYSPDTYIYIAWHRYRFNENEFWQAYEYFKRPGINFIPTVAFLNDMSEMVSLMKGELPEGRLRQSEEDVFLDHIREGLARSKGRGESYHCPSWDQLAIDETGQLLLCCGMTSHDSDHVLGNILEMSAKEIWETKSSDAFCRECISAGLARWLSESDFHSMPLPQREYSHSIVESG